MRTYSPIRSNPEQGGFTLLLSTIICGLLSMMSISFVSAVRTNVEIAREEAPAFHADLAVHSGSQYLLRQLSMDASWAGTGPDGVVLEDGVSRFTVERTEVLGPETARYEVVGEYGQARNALELTVGRTSEIDMLSTNVLVGLGGMMYLENEAVQGNVLVVDTLDDVVYEYEMNPEDPEDGDWEMGGPEELGDLNFDFVNIGNGELRKYTETDYGVTGTETTISAQVHAPKYNLAPYENPSAETVHYYGVSSLANVTLEETAVFHMEPGVTLKLKNSDFRGGVVVLVDQGYRPRDGHVNQIVLRNGTTIGTGDGGVHPNLGLYAPGCQLKAPFCVGLSEIEGVSYVNGIKAMHQTVIEGIMIVHNKVNHKAYGTMQYNETIAQNPPPGFEYFGGSSSEVALLEVREIYDEETIPEE